MNTGFPQYAMSTDPEVIAACEDMLERFVCFTEYAQKVSVALTGERDRSFYRGDIIRGCVVVGVSVKTKDEYDALPGQWLKWEGSGMQETYQNNPLRKDWKSNSHREAAIPGRPNIAWGERWMGPGAIFVHEGVAYSGFGFVPGPGDRPSELWEEIKTSEWHAAKEAYEESQEAAA